jgi:4-diphosphocytidyl-2-C-methyl-D-erythritol kinase
MVAPAGQDELVLSVPAKVNLYLEVVGRRPDGYHNVRTVMQAISLCDRLHLRRREDEALVFECSDDGVPAGEDNLVLGAARVLRDRCGVRQGATILLEKVIPVGGGLGGGSADCAVALLGLAELWGLRLSAGEYLAAAAELGSDVAFFTVGGTALCEGRGEAVIPIEDGPTMHYVLAMPGWHVSTAAVYGALESGLTSCAGASNNVARALLTGDARELALLLRNDLQAPAFALCEPLGRLWEEFGRAGRCCGVRGALLSGSGSSLFGLADGEEEAQSAADVLRTGLQVPCAAVHSVPAWHGRVDALITGRARL